MINIKDDNFEEIHYYKNLRNYFNAELLEMTKELDEEDAEKIRMFRDEFREKILNKT